MKQLRLTLTLLLCLTLGNDFTAVAGEIPKSNLRSDAKVLNEHGKKAFKNLSGEIYALGQPAGTNGSNADALDGTTVRTCDATFLDPGGASADYSDNQNYTLTFTSDNNGPINFDFGLSFDTEDANDYLEIFDGPSTTSRLLYRISGAHNNPFSQAGQIVSSGTSLTVHFVSNGFVNASGWNARVYCTAPETKVIGCSGGVSPMFFYKETFGTPVTAQDNVGPALPMGLTGYNYKNIDTTTGGAGNLFDGEYSILKNIKYGWFSPPLSEWHDAPDHTTGDGYMMAINASYGADIVYTNRVNGLSPNTTYVVSAWIRAANAQGAIDYCTVQVPTFENIKNVNVSFRILDALNNIVAVNSTGNIQPTDPDVLGWQQYSLYYTTGPSENSITFEIVNNAAGGCGNDFAIDDIEVSECPGGAILLPIRFIDFTATPSANRSVLLSWATGFEEKQQKFNIQRSADAKNWSTLTGLATNSLTNANKFSAVDPVALSGISYYRIAAIDNAGKINYSRVQQIRFVNSDHLKVLPNPFTDHISASFFASSAGSATIRVINIGGSTILQQEINFKEGENNIDLSDRLSLLKSGAYDLVISFKGHIYHEKLLKQ
jgi:CUB domain